jgi:23S rRNA pseudouridine2605 synthase
MSEVRLQKYLARAGVASRRASEQLITSGRVSVNGQVVTQLGTKVYVSENDQEPSDEVTLDGVLVLLKDEDVTLMLHKPAGYVTTMQDPQGRPCVASLVPLGQYPSLFPVGRLDRDTTGLLLFSTNGALGNKLLHPRHHVEKTYLALTLGVPTEKALEQLRSGVELSDGTTQPAKVELLEGEEKEQACQCFDFAHQGASGSSNAAQKMQREAQREARREVQREARREAQLKVQRREQREKQREVQRTIHNNKPSSTKDQAIVRITITEGRNRQVRRMMEAVGCPVIALHRLSFGPLSLGDLPRGQWRLLSSSEVYSLDAE